METIIVLKFAQSEGYATVNYLGKYKEHDLYKPLYEDPHIATGLPVYIIVKDDKPGFVRGREGLEIQKYRAKQRRMLSSVDEH